SAGMRLHALSSPTAGTSARAAQQGRTLTASDIDSAGPRIFRLLVDREAALPEDLVLAVPAAEAGIDALRVNCRRWLWRAGRVPRVAAVRTDDRPILQHEAAVLETEVEFLAEQHNVGLRAGQIALRCPLGVYGGVRRHDSCGRVRWDV